MPRTLFAALFTAALTVVSLTAQAAERPPWNTYIDDYIEAFFVAHPAFAVGQGRHEIDGQRPDWSKAGIDAEINRLKAQRAIAAAYPKTDLSPEQQFQREYVLAAIDRQLFWYEEAEWPYRSPAFYFDWLNDTIAPSTYVNLTYAPVEERLQAYIRWANNVPTATAQIRDNLRMPMARTVLKYGIDSFGGFASYMQTDVPLAFAAVKDKKLVAEFEAANAKAIAAFEALTEWLQSNQNTATDDYALGTELFQRMLYMAERVDISLEELEAIGRADMKRNQQALAEACESFAPGEDIRACFKKMANRKPEGGSVAAARRQLKELKAFVIEHDIVSIPGQEEALVEESPPYARSNFAFINIPGPYEVNQPSTYYISPPNPEWPADVQRDYIAGESDLLFTSVHEVWPGHFLNFVHANRADFTFGRVFVTYAYGEGWAHYTEEMMLDAGLRDASPETRIGQISNALLRNARFLSAIGLHTGKMTVAESEKLFMEEAYQGKGTAEQQANRGTYDPAYLNYTMAKLMIRKLRDDWTATRGGRKAWKAFHDQFLSYGGPPIPLVRGQMMATEAQAAF
jgi:uncharacterized protein (DUF885 family)